MTARKSTAAKTAASTVIDNDTQEVHRAQSAFSDAYEAFNEAMGGTESRNNVLRFVAKILLYAVGAVSTILCVAALSTAMMAGGWPLFIVMLTELCGWIFGIVASWHTAETIVDYVADGKLGEHLSAATGWLVGKFTATSSYVKSSMSSKTVH